MSDERGEPDGVVERRRPGESGGLAALQQAAREILSTTGAEPTDHEPTRPPSVEGSFDVTDADPAGRSADFVVRAGQVPPVPSSLLGQFGRTFRVKLVAGGLVVALAIVVVAVRVTSHKTGQHDVSAPSCVLRDAGAEATVVVTNHGDGAATYLFDVVFSRDQSPLVEVPLRVTALPAGGSATLHADSGPLGISTTPSCTIAKLQRLAEG